MHSFLGFLGTVTLLLGMVNHVHANTGREDAEGLQARVVLEMGEIDSSTVESGGFGHGRLWAGRTASNIRGMG